MSDILTGVEKESAAERLARHGKWRKAALAHVVSVAHLTPPWSVRYVSQWGLYAVVDSEGYVVVDANERGGLTEEEATLIVSAVNSYQAK